MRAWLMAFVVWSVAGMAEGASARAGLGTNLVNNSFETGGLDGWQTFGTGWRISDWAGGGGLGDAHEGKFGIVNNVAAGDTEEWRGVFQILQAKSSRTYSASAWIRCVNPYDTQSYIELHFLDKDGEVLGYYQSEPVPPDMPFARVSIEKVRPPKKTVSVSVRGVVHMMTAPEEGTAYHVFDDFVFEEVD
ncbi:MAG: hypothetical protein JXB04_09270 [Kiritimatiellae bacterium]|nr:hypothetical protein [Kiritimatiellia bacterium]